jgi:hypothetical protein
LAILSIGYDICQVLRWKFSRNDLEYSGTEVAIELSTKAVDNYWRRPQGRLKKPEVGHGKSN